MENLKFLESVNAEITSLRERNAKLQKDNEELHERLSLVYQIVHGFSQNHTMMGSSHSELDRELRERIQEERESDEEMKENTLKEKHCREFMKEFGIKPPPPSIGVPILNNVSPSGSGKPSIAQEILTKKDVVAPEPRYRETDYISAQEVED